MLRNSLLSAALAIASSNSAACATPSAPATPACVTILCTCEWVCEDQTHIENGVGGCVHDQSELSVPLNELADLMCEQNGHGGNPLFKWCECHEVANWDSTSANW